MDSRDGGAFDPPSRVRYIYILRRFLTRRDRTLMLDKKNHLSLLLGVWYIEFLLKS
jgi:hypothetical protein